MQFDFNSSVLEPLTSTVMTQLPSIVGAVFALLVGWVVARLLGKLVQRLVYRLTHNKTVQGLTEIKDDYRVDKVMGMATYYLAMLFVLVLVLDILGVSAVMTPFLAMTGDLAGAIPALLKAGLILLAAWVIAKVLSQLTIRLIANRPVGQMLNKLGVVENQSAGPELSRTAGQLVYYVVLIIFLPAVLGALNLDGLRGPFESAMTSILNFLPHVLAATITILIGWVAARVVRGIVTHFLASIGTDSLPEKVGMGRVFAQSSLSSALGTIAFVLILIPVSIAALEQLGIAAISDPAIAMLTVILEMIPSVAIALVLLVIGTALARWVGQLTASLLTSTNISQFLVKWGLLKEDDAEKAQPTLPAIVGDTVSGIVLLLVLIEVFEIVRLTALSDILTAVLAYLPNVLVAVAILAVGWAVAQFADRSLRGVLNQTTYPLWLGSVARFAVLTLAGMMALEQLGVAQAIVVNAFTILLGSFGLAAALAVGFGSRGAVRRYIDQRTQSSQGIQSTQEPTDSTQE